MWEERTWTDTPEPNTSYVRIEVGLVLAAVVGLVVVVEDLDAIMVVSSVFWRLFIVGSVDTDVGEVWAKVAVDRNGVDMVLRWLVDIE